MDAASIPAHTTYECIQQVATGRTFFAARSIGVNHGRETTHCTVYAKATMEALGGVHFVHSEGHLRSMVAFLDDEEDPLPESPPPSDPRPADLLFLGDVLYILQRPLNDGPPSLYLMDWTDIPVPPPMPSRDETTLEDFVALRRQREQLEVPHTRHALDLPTLTWGPHRPRLIASVGGLYLEGRGTDGSVVRHWHPASPART